MTENLALEFVKRRMHEMGMTDYALRLRHFVVPPMGVTQVDAWNEYFVLVKDNCDVHISSDFGVYDLSAEYLNELQYEHQGAIIMKNHSESSAAHIEFLHVIPVL